MINILITGASGFLGSSIINHLSKKIFSMNEIWDNYIKKENLYGFESSIEFLHLTDKDIYEKLLQKG